MTGGKKGPTVLPFRGTYHELKPEVRSIITRNIYPVPDPKYVSFICHSLKLLSFAVEKIKALWGSIMNMFRFMKRFLLSELKKVFVFIWQK